MARGKPNKDDCVEASDWKQVTHVEDQYKFHPMNHYSFNADYREVAKRLHRRHVGLLAAIKDGFNRFITIRFKLPWC